MTRGKGLKRLAFFVVFLIPVAWYLFLQLFGDNRFNIAVLQEVPNHCNQFSDITIIYRTDSIKASQGHYFNRIKYYVDTKKIPLTLDEFNFFNCLQNDKDLLIVNYEGLWGDYNLDREGVDLLLTELDILLLQKSYGKGVSR